MSSSRTPTIRRRLFEPKYQNVRPTGDPVARQNTPRLSAVALLLCLLVLLGVSLGNPAARLSEHAPHTYAQGDGTPLRHAVMTAAGRFAMAALRPVAKKMGAKGADGALPVAGVTFIAPHTPGGAPSDGHGPRLPEPAPHGYLARAPPALA